MAILYFGTGLAADAQAHPVVTSTDESTFERAEQLLDSGRATEARPLLESLHQKHPQSFEINESLGLLYAGTGNVAGALPLLQAGAKLAPGSAVAHANLGTAYLKLGRYATAAGELRRAAVLDPTDTQTQNALGQVMMLTKQPCRAAEAFTAAGKSDASDADLVYNTALALYDCGKPALAAQELTAMPGLEGSSAAQSLMGDIEEQQKHVKEAAAHYLRATQIDPSEANLYVFGMDLLRHWSFDPAIAAFDEGARRYPASQRMHAGLGIADYGAARYNDAIQVFASLLKSEPNNALYAEIYGRSCTVLTDSRDPLCANLTALAQQHPANENLALYAATAMLHQPSGAQDPVLAQQLLESALKSGAKLPDAHYEMGVLLQQQGKWAESIPQLQAALAEDPSYARAHYRLGLAYSRTSRKQEAQKQMALDREEDQQQKDDLDARMRQITTLLVKMR